MISSQRPFLTGLVMGSAMTWIGTVLISKAVARWKKSGRSDQVNNNAQKKEIPQHIRDEQLSRHTLYFGNEGMSTIKNSSIVIVGLGGVGSHVAHMLARAGVGHLRLIDFDQVTLSSLNRHACATLDDVGISKVTCMKNFIEKICPDNSHIFVEALVEMYTAEKGLRLLDRDNTIEASGGWDIVIDAIDDVPTKAALLADCLKAGIRVMSCMGAGGKSDATRLHISDLRTASKDPLASKLRQCMKKILPEDFDYDKSNDGVSYMESMEKLAIIYSSEKPVVKLADFTPEQKSEGVHKFGAVDGMRIRVLPVLGTMPAIMGQTLAAMALCELGRKPISPVTGERVGRNVRNKMFQQLKRREDKFMKQMNDTGEMIPQAGKVTSDGTWIGPLQVDHDDVEYLLELWRNRCAVTGARLGTVLSIVRWNMTKPSTCDNLVIMGVQALSSYDSKGGINSVSGGVRQRIEDRLKTCVIY